jgi:hypothetical protein
MWASAFLPEHLRTTQFSGWKKSSSLRWLNYLFVLGSIMISAIRSVIKPEFRFFFAKIFPRKRGNCLCEGQCTSIVEGIGHGDQIGRLFIFGNGLKITEVRGTYFCTAAVLYWFWEKMGWAPFCATFSQTHLVTLVSGKKSLKMFFGINGFGRLVYLTIFCATWFCTF